MLGLREPRRLSYVEATNLSDKIVKGKLSAIYQFAKAMPLLFVHAPHVKGGDKIGGTNKRKLDGES